MLFSWKHFSLVARYPLTHTLSPSNAVCIFIPEATERWIDEKWGEKEMKKKKKKLKFRRIVECVCVCVRGVPVCRNATRWIFDEMCGECLSSNYQIIYYLVRGSQSIFVCAIVPQKMWKRELSSLPHIFKSFLAPTFRPVRHTPWRHTNHSWHLTLGALDKQLSARAPSCFIYPSIPLLLLVLLLPSKSIAAWHMCITLSTLDVVCFHLLVGGICMSSPM